MATVVKTLFSRSFNMPPSCVACGSTPSPWTNRKVSRTESNRWVKTTVTLFFPLCQECYDVSSDSRLAKLLSGVAILISIGLCLLPFFAPWDAIKDPFLRMAVSRGIVYRRSSLGEMAVESDQPTGVDS